MVAGGTLTRGGRGHESLLPGGKGRQAGSGTVLRRALSPRETTLVPVAPPVVVGGTQEAFTTEKEKGEMCACLLVFLRIDKKIAYVR